MSDILLLGRANAARTPFNPETEDLVTFVQSIVTDKYNNRYADDRKVLINILGPQVLAPRRGHVSNFVYLPGTRYQGRN